MYDQTGSTDPNPFAGFENQDIFGQFKRGNGSGKRGSQAEDFSSIFEELFGGGGQTKKNRGDMNDHSEDINLKVDLDFFDAVNGISKVLNSRFRRLRSSENAFALPARVQKLNLEQNHKNVICAMDPDL